MLSRKKLNYSTPPKIAMGFTNTVDYETRWNLDNIINNAQRLGIHNRDIQHLEQIASYRELLCTILYYMKRNEGCGLFVNNQHLLDEYIKGCTYTRALGGTAIRASIILSKFGVPSLVHLVSNNDDTRELLPEDVYYYCSATEDSNAPHVVIQYPANLEIKFNDINFTTRFPNRLIFTNDNTNSEIIIDEDFLQESKKCNIVLLSSLELIQSYSTLDKTIDRCIEVYSNSKSIIMYEDACFIKKAYSELIWEKLGPLTDIYSMNEDELQYCIGKRIDILNIEDLLKGLNTAKSITNAKMLVLHTKYYALAYGEGVDKYYGALELGVKVASARYLYGDDMTSSNIETLVSFPRVKASLKLQKELLEQSNLIGFIPSYDIKTPNPTTIGLGDAFVGGFLVGVLITTGGYYASYNEISIRYCKQREFCNTSTKYSE